MARKAEFTDITPSMAELLLTKNTHNRPIDRFAVVSYIRDMLAGQWDSNGETIKIAMDGTIIDGQHRLTAIVESGVTLEGVLLVTGLPLSVQKTVDGGRKRNMSQDLKLNGVAHSPIVTSIVMRGWLWDNGDTKFTRAVRPTRMELDKYWQENSSQISRAAEVASRTRTQFRPVRQSTAGFVHLILGRISIGDTAEFFAALGSGAGLKDGDALLALRNRLANDHVAKVNQTEAVRVGLMLRTWNAFRDGEKLSKIQFTAESKMPEPK